MYASKIFFSRILELVHGVYGLHTSSNQSKAEKAKKERMKKVESFLRYWNQFVQV